MRYLTLIAALALPLAPALAQDAAPADPAVAPKPAALVADGMPPVPAALASATRPYMENRGAGFSGWDPTTRAMLIGTRFANTTQLHRVAMPMGARTQLTFEAEPVGGGSYAPKRGDVLLVQKDIGGNEFFQIFALKNGRLDLLTDGKSRNGINAWSKDGELVAYTSTRRTGRDSDIYVMDPRNPASNRMVAQVNGGGWFVAAIAPDKNWALVGQGISVQKTNPFKLDMATGALTPIGDHSKTISYQGADIAPDGTIWVTSDEGSEFQRLGTLDPATGKFAPKGPAEKWDVDTFDISDDGTFIAYVTNEAGMSKLKIMDVKTQRVRTVDALPAGIVGSVGIAPWGEIGLTFTSARSAADAWSVDPKTLQLTRWTQSETGGLDVTRNVEPELVTVKSFDGLDVSGFLYRPDAKNSPASAR